MMQEAREAQLKMRQHAMAEETRAQRKEYQDTIAQAWRAADREEREYAQRKKATADHQTKLLEQIAVKAQMRERVHSAKKQEGRTLKKEFQMELAKLEHKR